MEEGAGFRPLRARNGELGAELVFESAPVERQPALVAPFPYQSMNTAIRYLRGCEASKLERFFCRVVKQEGQGWVMVSQGPRSIQQLLGEETLLRKLQALALSRDAVSGACPGAEIEAGELEPASGLAEGAGEVGPGPALDEQTRAAVSAAVRQCPCLRPIWLPVTSALTRSQADQVRVACPWVMSSIVPLYDIARVLSSAEEGYLAQFMSMAVELAREGVRRGYEFNAAIVVAAEKRRAVGGAYSLQRPQDLRRLEGKQPGGSEKGGAYSEAGCAACTQCFSVSPPSAIPLSSARGPAPIDYPYSGDAAADIRGFAEVSETRFSPLLHAARNAIRVKAMTPIDDYLLTGYDVFSVREPCIMCAMSLIHSRIRTLFYCLPRESNGGANPELSVPQLKSVNHRYAVVHLKGCGELLR